MENGSSFPTILVAEDDDGIAGSLIGELQRLGYFVLVAHDGPEATEIVRVHSRPIHLMLTSESVGGRTLAATLKQYRPHMRVLFIARLATEEAPDPLKSDEVLAKVRELLKPPAAHATELMDGRRAFGEGRNVPRVA